MFRGRVLRDAKPKEFDPPRLEETAEEKPCGPQEEAPPPGEEAAQLAQRAWREGFESGRRAGMEQARGEAEPLLLGLRGLLRAMEEERGKALQRLEGQVFDLAVAIARRVVLDEISLRPELLVGIVREAIRRIEKGGGVKVRVHPDIYEVFARHRRELLELHEEVAIEVDPSVPPSGPLVVGPAEEVATDPEEQIRNIVEQVKEALAVG